MKPLSIPLSKCLYFEVPHDYATACQGNPVRVSDANIAQDTLTIQWDDEWVVFASGSHAVAYLRSAVIQLDIGRPETVEGVEFRAARVRFREGDGTVHLLPFLTTEPSNSQLLADIARQLESAGFPAAIRMY